VRANAATVFKLGPGSEGQEKTTEKDPETLGQPLHQRKPPTCTVLVILAKLWWLITPPAFPS